MITRFAPSPTGYLHYGHAYAAEQAFGYAQKHGGACLLRIEDIDHTRCKAELTDAISEDLKWLGFNWPTPVRIQSEHQSDYKILISDLSDKGLLYRCFKTRKDLPKGLYRGAPDLDETIHLKNEKPFSWRLSISQSEQVLGQTYPDLSDEIIARKDIGNSYLLACTYDDALQNITHVVRGEDMKSFTAYQILLQKLMGWPTPDYIHHEVVKNPDGKKLSKRNQDTTIRSLRAQGLSPADVMAMAGV